MKLMEYLLLLSKFNTAYAQVTCRLSGDLILPCFKPKIWPNQSVSFSCLDFKILWHFLSGSPYAGGQLPRYIQQVPLFGKPLLCCNARLFWLLMLYYLTVPLYFFPLFLSISVCCPLHYNLNCNKSRADAFWLFACCLPQKAPAPRLVVPDGTVMQTLKIIS